MTIPILLAILGFGALIFGADWLVSGASSLAKKYKVPDLVVGLTIVAFGTSAPELIVNVVASSKNYDSIVLGNIIGSNNFNLFVILGIVGLIYPIKVQTSTAWKEIPLSLLAALLVLFLANNFFSGGEKAVSRIDGILMLGCFFAIMVYIFRQMKQEEGEDITLEKRSTWQLAGLILLGLAGLLIGGQLVIRNSIIIAQGFGVSEKIIGLTIVAAGTSLPELVTSIVAAFRQKSDIAIGNVIGSNIFNLLLILSISSIIAPITYPSSFNMDLGMLIGGTVLLLVGMVTGVKKRLDRWEASLLLILFIVYSVYFMGH